MANNQETESGLTPGDYKRYFLPSTRWMVGTFLVILLILSALFWWFQQTMRANSNDRVTEAVAMLERFDRSDTDANQDVTPLTLELEEMRAETQRNREFLAENLLHDSYPRQVEKDLKQRYLDQSYYGELPDNWREQLPQELRQWKQQQDRQQIARLRGFLKRLPTIVETHKENLSRLTEIRSELDFPDTFTSFLKRYEQTRSIFEERLSALEEASEAVSSQEFNQIRIPGELFQAAKNMLDPMLWMELQYRRFSGFSSAPASIFYAEQALQDALRIDPKNPEAYFQLGRVYERLGLDAIAGEHYLRALRVSRNEGYRRKQQIVSMMEEQQQANPGSSRALYELGWAYYEQGKEKQALHQLLRVIENECSLSPLRGIEKTYKENKKKRAMNLVQAVINRECKGQSSMELTLTEMRISYILEGEPPYHRLTYF